MTNKLPKIFLERLSQIYSPQEVENILSGFNIEKKTTFRINTLKSNKQEIEEYLKENNIEFSITSFSPICYIIDKKYEFSLKGSRIFYDGKIYLQSISSQIPSIILDLQENEKILDITAAPGGKTTQIAAIMNNSGKIIAVEQNQIRYDKLNYNIKLQGVTNTETLKFDSLKLANKFSNNFFDRILLDAPCSAEGRIFLPNEKTYSFWSLDNITKKQKLQLELLEVAIKILKKGGTLVYSTCTLAPEENEEVIDIILNKYPDLKLEEINISLENTKPGIIEFEGKKYSEKISNTIRILPSELTEGFYLAKIKKN